MLRNQSINACVDEIFETSKSMGFVKINLIGASSSGKTVLGSVLAHQLHTRDPTFEVHHFEDKDLIDFKTTIQNLSKSNQILIFDDLSGLVANFGKQALDKLKSELTTVMVGGFATIAGGVLAGVSAMGIDIGYLVAASVMSAPAALVVGKIIFPEKEKSETSGNTQLPDIKVGSNVVEAASNGIIDGLKLAVNVGAMLLGFIAIIAVLDSILNWLDNIIDGSLLKGIYYQYAASGFSPTTGEFSGYFPGSLQTLFGGLLKPLAFIMGAPASDMEPLGNLLGLKISLNEFVAYSQLGEYIKAGLLTPKGQIIATYALCGFANFSSIGIQIGGISAIAPKRKEDLARIALKAMFGGAIASWITATIAGILI